jgi:hypothetical protein
MKIKLMPGEGKLFKFVKSTYGTISTNTIWSEDTRVLGDVTIASGCTLTILPGVEVSLLAKADSAHGGINSSRCELTVNGMLKAEGTITDSIVFTSSSFTPTHYDWYGIIDNTGRVSMKYCQVKYPKAGITAQSSADSVKINHCLFTECYDYGIYCYRGKAGLDSNRITNMDSASTIYGIYLASPTGRAVVQNNIVEKIGKTGGTVNGICVASDSIKILKNNIVRDIDNGSTRRGIYLNGADKTTVTGNLLENFNGTTAYGIYVYASSYDTITGNVIKNKDGKFGYGIYLSSGGSIKIANDTISNCQSIGITVNNSSRVTLIDNVLKDNSSAKAITASSSGAAPSIISNSIMADTSAYSCITGIYNDVSATAKIRNNRIEDFTNAGIMTNYDGAKMDCGTATDWGLNSIYWNFDTKGDTIGLYFVKNDTLDSMNALYNYYGPSVPAGGNFNGRVRWNPYLGSDPNVYFADNFNDGNDNGWTKSGGTWAVENGEYSVFSTAANQFSLADSLHIKNLAIELQAQNKQFCVTSSDTQGAGVAFRYKDIYNYVKLFYTKKDSQLVLKADSLGVAWVPMGAYTLSPAIDTSKKDTLRIVAYNGDYQVSRNGAVIMDVVRASADNFLSDRFGVGTYYSGGGSHSHFDNIEVYPVFFFENFKDTAIAWKKVSGTWARQNEQYSGNGTNDTSIVYVDSLGLFNCVVECDVTDSTDTAMVLLRYRNSKNYVGLKLERNYGMRLGMRVGGVWTEYGSYNDSLKQTKHNFKISAFGDDYEVYKDGVKRINATFKSDSLTSSSTKVGLRVSNSGHAHFDNILVTKHVSYTKGALEKQAIPKDNPELVIVRPTTIEDKFGTAPNPFNMTTRILYSVPVMTGKEQINTSLAICDMNGNSVRSLVNGYKIPGMYGTTWDGHNERNQAMKPGVYFCRLQTDDKIKVEKIILSK